MPSSDKRARKKQHRDEVLARRLVERRRRRIMRSIGGVAIVVVLLVLALNARDGGEVADDRTDRDAGETPAAVACGGPEATPAEPEQYESPPPPQLEDGVDYRALIETSCGTIEVDLFEDEAPVNVNNFVFLAREGFYDDTTWHRIERNFVIQGGDPDGQNGDPPDGPGYAIEDELPQKPSVYVYGILAMANGGQPDTGGSQFFIIVHEPRDQPAGLQPAYSVFGKVAKRSFPVLDALAKLETIGGSDPVESVKPRDIAYVYAVTIVEA